tara:strand:+ start:163 stop:330 length:168 start_codon:yes stop_codon:yes gene_type:complete
MCLLDVVVHEYQKCCGEKRLGLWLDRQGKRRSFGRWKCGNLILIELNFKMKLRED